MQVRTKEDLRKLLLSIDHRGYPAYKETRGRWSFGSFILSIDHVQGDPFASPSNVSVIVPGRIAQFPETMIKETHRRIALQDHLLRLFGRELAGREAHHAGSGKSGLIITSRPGQEILERSACRVDPSTGNVTARFQIGFPANGRTINAGELIRILDGFLPEAVSSSLICKNIHQGKLEEAIRLSDDQHFIRQELRARGLCAFVADGSVLPRQSGISQLPMKGAVRFNSPDALSVTMELPHRGVISGMGIPRGVTLIVGGGYHGKSTLLQALERGVYDHISGDGREFVITDSHAVKVRAEDGRSIVSTDISMFINDLPNGKDTVRFMTEDASGSTSQAANVIEAMEAGTDLLLIDEDTCATNFMVRDELMAKVVSADKEPITPFISRIRDLYEQEGISTILVAGSCGAFFHVADTVIQMDRYMPVDITAHAKEVAQQEPMDSLFHPDTELAAPAAASSGSTGISANPKSRRVPVKNSALAGESRIKLKILSEDQFVLMKDEVDVRGLEQIVDREQTAALAYLLRYLQIHVIDGKMTLSQIVDRLEQMLERKGLEELFDGGTVSNGLAAVRREEIFGMINRYRKLKIKE